MDIRLALMGTLELRDPDVEITNGPTLAGQLALHVTKHFVVAHQVLSDQLLHERAESGVQSGTERLGRALGNVARASAGFIAPTAT